jgi:2,3-bisphosphoglycerate-dependent phosphoglycerate mutase
MRHGQSVWNRRNLFTGWVDVPLSEEGVSEAIEGGKKIQDLPIDVVFTSALIRSQMTACLALLSHCNRKVPVFQHEKGSQGEEWSRIYSAETLQGTIPVHVAPELNERMYGQLQGLNKEQIAQQFGAEQVQIWRRSYDTAPPGGESLKMTIARSLPYFKQKVVPHLEKGSNVFLVAHGNSIRGIVMDLDGLSEEEVVKLEIATGSPLLYTYDRGIWKRS